MRALPLNPWMHTHPVQEEHRQQQKALLDKMASFHKKSAVKQDGQMKAARQEILRLQNKLHLQDQQLQQMAHPIQPGPDERRVSYAKSQRGRMTTGSIVSTRAADEEMEDGRIRNREAATKIRDAWIYKQIRARQVRAC